MKVKTIDIQAFEWFDKVNGNSYFAGTVTVNYGMKDVKVFTMPFQYGYGDSYKDKALKTLQENGMFKESDRLWELRDKGIIVRATMHFNCKKSQLKQIV